MTDEKCKYCGGDGYHHVPRTPGITCEACDGTGFAEPDASKRETYDENLLRWLQGLADHSDGAEYDTLQMLISMVENGEHIEAPIPAVDPNWAAPAPDANCPF